MAWPMRPTTPIRNGITSAALALLCAITAYGTAGMIGGAIPSHADWRQPTEGVRIYLDDNGIHTGIVVPVTAAGVDWRDLVRPGDIADPRYADYDHIEIGWGDRQFYMQTPTWADLRPITLLRAAIGSGDTLIHIDHIPAPQPGERVRAIMLSPDQYRRLAAAIRAQFITGGKHHHGYGGWDAFYEARGRYSAIHTCNAWTGDMLRAAGIRIGVWTPFPVTVLGWF